MKLFRNMTIYFNFNGSLLYIIKEHKWHFDSKELKVKLIKKLPLFIRNYRQHKVERLAREIFGTIKFIDLEERVKELEGK